MSFNIPNFVLLLTIVSVIAGSQKFDDGGFVPSSMIYLKKNTKSEDQTAMSSQERIRGEVSIKQNGMDTNRVTERNQEPRFGFTNLGNTGTGYGVSSFAPSKIDLGGLLLGAVIGVSSILIIPKLLYVISGTYGNYARSEESGFTQIVTKLDDILVRHEIDTTSCMQRAMCTYSQQAATSIQKNNDETISSFDRVFDMITSNQIFHTAMEGTAIQEAVESGRNGSNCSRSYPHCGLSMETILSLLSNVMSMVNLPKTGNVVPTGPGTL